MARRRQEPWYAFAALVLRPLLTVTTRRSWTHTERLPRSGGIVVVPNHISHSDPLAVAHFLYDNGRLPRFLAKASLFEVFFVRRVLCGARQIPVYRQTRDANDAYREAVAAVHDGQCVVVYAEGTLTRDPDLWPMAGKTGAARIGLETGCPVVPMAVWGPQRLLPPYSKRPHLFPRPTMQVTVGEPVELSDLRGRRDDPAVLREATDRIMAAVTCLVGELRGQQPPHRPLDLRLSNLATLGDPHVQYHLDRHGQLAPDPDPDPDPASGPDRAGGGPAGAP